MKTTPKAKWLDVLKALEYLYRAWANGDDTTSALERLMKEYDEWLD